MEFCKAEGLVLLADEVCTGELLHVVALKDFWASAFPAVKKVHFQYFLKDFFFVVLDYMIDNLENLGIPRKCLCS